MKIEVPIRWKEYIQTPEALEARNNRRIISGDEDVEVEENVRYYYDYMTFDIEDVIRFYPFNEQHTIVCMVDENSFCVHLPYESFKDIYAESTGKLIMKYRSPEPELIEEQ